MEPRFVLIVDDETPLLSLDEKFLSTERFEIATAQSGEAALALLDRSGRRPDLLITDYMMGGMNGRELAEAVRQRWPGVKVLYQTGFCDQLFGPRDLLEDDTAFIEKPFTARGLREAARLMLFGSIKPEEEPAA